MRKDKASELKGDPEGSADSVKLYFITSSKSPKNAYGVSIHSIMRGKFGLMLLLGFAAVVCWLPFARAADAVTPTITDHDANQSPLAKCLPPGIKLSDVVEATRAGNANGQLVKPHQITVEQKLTDLKATCNRENKLVDENGRQIVFYHLTGCWGNPPPNYQELLQKQRGEIERLKRQYTVIEMTCNPSGAQIS